MIAIVAFKNFFCIPMLRGHDHSISAVRCLPLILSSSTMPLPSSDGADDVATPLSTGVIMASVALERCSRNEMVKFKDLECIECGAVWCVQSQREFGGNKR
mmetsp:Transcript_59324/g.70770  ORF Transcript_59324/g.70770 Transcript_59324/m.70770 type:complete len:101 (+) Transcript_59324:56-358(+)